jgi:hypothetical protein
VRRALLLTVVALLIPLSAEASVGYWFSNYSTQPNTGGTRYGIPQGMQGTMNATEANVVGVIPVNITMKSMSVIVSAAPNTGNSWVITFRMGAVGAIADTALTCTIADAATSCTISSDVAITGPVLTSVSVQGVSTPDAAQIAWMFTYQPATDGETIRMSSTFGTALSTAATQYMTLLGNRGPAAAETIARMILPGEFTASDLCVYLPTTPGAGDSRTFWGFKNGATTSQPTVVFDEDDVDIECDSSTENAADAGDTYAIASLLTGTPAASIASAGMVFKADTPGHFILGSSNIVSLDSMTTQYMAIAGMGGITTMADSTIGTVQSMGAAGFKITAIHARVDAAPGAGNTWTIQLRHNASDAAFTALSINGGAATTDSETGSFTPSNGSLLNVSIVPDSVPSGTTMNIGLLGDSRAPGGGGQMMLLGCCQ